MFSYLKNIFRMNETRESNETRKRNETRNDNYIGSFKISTSKEKEEQMPSEYVLKDYGQPGIFDVDTESYLLGLKCDNDNGCSVTRGGYYDNGYYGRKIGGVERPLLNLPPGYIYDNPEEVNKIKNVSLGYYNAGDSDKKTQGTLKFKNYKIELENDKRVGKDTRYR